MLCKMIANFNTTAYKRVQQGLFIENFVNFAYDDLKQKFNLRKFTARKLREFLYGLAKHRRNLRC